MQEVPSDTPLTSSKIPSGVSLLDERHGGIPAGRGWILSGSSGTGKSDVALQFIAQGLRLEERCLLLSVKRVSDTVLWAASSGIGIAKAIESGRFHVLEYGDFVPNRDESDPSLPPEGFLDLQEIIQANAIRRVVLDTVVPWAMTPHLPSLMKRALSLVRAFDRLQCTTLMTLPHPASDPAQRLKHALETCVPVTVDLSLSLETGERFWKTTKYLGVADPGSPEPFTLIPGSGAVPPAQTTATSQHAGTYPAGRKPGPASRARISPAILGGEETLSGRAPDRTARYGISLPR